MRSNRAALLATLPLLVLPLRAWGIYRPFAVVGDSHVGSRKSAYSRIIEEIEAEHIDLIIHTGDAINKPGDIEQWKEFLRITGPDKTLYLAPGNHDLRSKRSFSIFSQFFPKSYQSFSQGDTLFILLNTDFPGERHLIQGIQMEWLKRELKRSFRYRFVFLHEPLFPVVPLHSLDVYRWERNRLHRLFVESGVSLVISGHDHLYKRSRKNGITYVITGGGGGPRAFFAKNSEFYHYMIASRVDDGYLFTVKDTNGRIHDQFNIQRSAEERGTAITRTIASAPSPTLE